MKKYGKVDDNQREIVKALRAAGCEVVSTAAMGGGFPDLLVYRPSHDRLTLIEIKDGNKSPSKRKLTSHQLAFHARWPVNSVHNIDVALQAVGITDQLSYIDSGLSKKRKLIK